MEWRRLLDKNSGASFADIDAFLKSNPDWPARDTLFARAETALRTRHQPRGHRCLVRQSLAGDPRLAASNFGEAMMATGSVDEGRGFVRQGWREGNFDPPQELAINVQKDGSLLQHPMTTAGVWTIFSGKMRSPTPNASSRASGYDASQRIGGARIALRTDPGHARNLIANLPPAAPHPTRACCSTRRAPRVMSATMPARRHSSLQIFFTRRRTRPSIEMVGRVQRRCAPGSAGSRLPHRLQHRDRHGPRGRRGIFGGPVPRGLWIALRFLKDPQSALDPHFQRGLDAAVTRPGSAKKRAQLARRGAATRRQAILPTRGVPTHSPRSRPKPSTARSHLRVSTRRPQRCTCPTARSIRCQRTHSSRKPLPVRWKCWPTSAKRTFAHLRHARSRALFERAACTTARRRNSRNGDSARSRSGSPSRRAMTAC